MRSTKVISITLPPEMAAEAEKLAKEEGRTMSELMREAFRRYRQESALDGANRYGKKKAKEKGLTEKDVVRLIKEYRAEEQQPGRRKRSTGS